MKTAVFTLLHTISFICVQSQSWHYGLKTGLNNARLKGIGVSSEFNYNFQGGVFAEKVVIKRWSILAELVYDQTKYKRAEDFLKYYPNTGRYNSRETMYLSYLTLPILVRYTPSKYISVTGGAQYGVRVLSNENLLKNNLDAFNRNEFALIAGAEISPLDFLSLYIRYSRGLTDINAVDNRYSWRSERIETGIAARIW